MATKDLAANCVFKQSIIPAAARTTTTTGNAVGVAGYESVTICILTGTVTDGTGTWSLTECDTVGGTYTAVAAADMIGTPVVTDTTSTHDSAGFIFGYRGTKPFIKVVCTMAGTTTGQVYSAGVLLGHPRKANVGTGSTGPFASP